MSVIRVFNKRLSSSAYLGAHTICILIFVIHCCFTRDKCIVLDILLDE